MRKNKFGLMKSIQFRLLVICFGVLLFLVLFWFGLNLVQDDDLEKLSGELRTLSPWRETNEVGLSVLNYNLSEDNMTISVNVTWSSGNISQEIFENILFDFIMGDVSCNYSFKNDLEFNENKIYDVEFLSLDDCGHGNFVNVSDVVAYAQIHINLTQAVIPIPNVTIYNGDSLVDVINLDDYFSSLVNISYSIVGDVDTIGIKINETTNKISFDPRAIGKYNVFEFNLTASEIDGDILDFSTSGKNMSFYVEFVNATRPVSNDAPEFDDEDCDSFTIDVNKTSVLKKDMSVCWEDDDDLDFRFNNYSMKNISWVDNGTEIVLRHRVNFIGVNYFYMYADDGVNDEVSSGKIYVYVIDLGGVSVPSPIVPLANDSDPKILSSNVNTKDVYISDEETKSFSITAKNYDVINWYLNNVLMKTNSTNFNSGELNEGNYGVKVEIKRDNKIDSKTWNLIVENIEETSEEFALDGFGIKNVIFYCVVSVLVIMMFFVVWLFIIEKNKKHHKTKIGFGVSG